MQSTTIDFSQNESKIEQQCALIMKTDPEFWEVRNKALHTIKSIINEYEGLPPAQLSEAFSPNLSRLLKEPVKEMISDLRSQQVRDTCLVLIRLSEIGRDHFKGFLREAFPFLLDAVKVPNRVISGYVDNCVLNLIKNTTFRTCIPVLVNESKDSKAKHLRERCLEYLNEILVTWEITEREAELIAETIKLSLEDASVKAREIARFAYLHLFQIYPKKTEKIKTLVPTALRSRLDRAEKEFLANHSTELQAMATDGMSVGSTNSGHSSTARGGGGGGGGVTAPKTPAVASARPKTAPAAATGPKKKPGSAPPATTAPSGMVNSASMQSIATTASTLSTTASMNNLGSTVSLSGSTGLSQTASSGSLPTSATKPKPIGTRRPNTSSGGESAENSRKKRESLSDSTISPILPKPSVQLRSRRTSFEEDCATSIQAMVRGKLQRKNSLTNTNMSSEATSPNGSSMNVLESLGIPEQAGLDIDCVETAKPVVSKPAASSSKTVVAPITKVVAPSHPNSAPTTPRKQGTGEDPASGNKAIVAAMTTPSPVKYQRKYDSRGMPIQVTPSRPEVSRLSSSTPQLNASIEESPSRVEDLQLGCLATVKGKDPPLSGTIRFVGPTQFASGTWVGLELKSPIGKNNGTVQDHSYFSCPDRHGLFVRASQLSLLERNGVSPGNAESELLQEQQLELQQQLQQQELQHRRSVSGILKLKVFSLMKLLNEELLLAERLESVANAANGISPEEWGASLQDLQRRTAEEMAIIQQFEGRLQDS